MLPGGCGQSFCPINGNDTPRLLVTEAFGRSRAGVCSPPSKGQSEGQIIPRAGTGPGPPELAHTAGGNGGQHCPGRTGGFRTRPNTCLPSHPTARHTPRRQVLARLEGHGS